MGTTRQAFVYAFYGKTGAGKTQTAIQFAKYWRSCNPGKKVIGFDPHGDFEDAGVLNHTIEETDTNWPQILMTKICGCCGKIKHPEKENCVKCGKDNWKFKFAGCLLILDDYRSLLTSDSTPKDVLRLFALKRKIGLDIILIMHNPKMLIVRLSFLITSHFIFATESLSGNFNDRITKYVPCQKAANLINHYVEALGGVDEDKYRNMRPDFPYIMVTNQSDELQTFNMDEKLVNKLVAEWNI